MESFTSLPELHTKYGRAAARKPRSGIFVTAVKILVTSVRIFVTAVRTSVTAVKIFVTVVTILVTAGRIFVTVVRISVTVVRIFVAAVRINCREDTCNCLQDICNRLCALVNPGRWVGRFTAISKAVLIFWSCVNLKVAFALQPFWCSNVRQKRLS